MKSFLLPKKGTKNKKHWRWPHHNAYTMCHTHGVMNWHDGTSSKGPRRDTDMKINEHLWASVPVTDQKKRAHQWWLMGARAKVPWKTKAVKCLTSYTEGPDPTEQVTRCHHQGNEHEPPYGRHTMLLGTSTCIHHTGGVSSSPASLFIFSFPWYVD